MLNNIEKVLNMRLGQFHFEFRTPFFLEDFPSNVPFLIKFHSRFTQIIIKKKSQKSKVKTLDVYTFPIDTLIAG